MSKLIVLGALFSCTVVACDDIDAPGIGRTAATSSIRGGSIKDGKPKALATSVADVRVEGRSTVQMTGNVRADRDASARVSMLLVDPDTVVFSHKDLHPRYLDETESRLAAHSNTSKLASYTFKRPGYYRMAINASEVGTGESVSSFVYVLFDGTQTTVSRTYKRPDLGDSLYLAYGSYGPFRTKHGTPSPSHNDELQPTHGPAVSHTDKLIDIYVQYYNENTYPWQMTYVYGGTFGYQCAGVGTYNSGYFTPGENQVETAVCPYNADYIEYSWVSDNSIVKVVGSARAVASIQAEARIDSLGGELIALVDNNAVASEFSIFNGAIPATQAAFGSRAKNVVVVTDTFNDFYDFHYMNDSIFILPNHTWPSVLASKSIIHEYLHSFHNTNMGGIPTNTYQSTSTFACPDSGHTSFSYDSRGCAFVEGFAEFGAAWMTTSANDTNGDSDWFIEADSARTFGDGTHYEIAVAAFLYDLVDGTAERDNYSNTAKVTEAFDSLTLPATYIVSLVNTCSLNVGGTTYHPIAGIDELIYCMENTLESQKITSTAPYTFTSYSESTTEPSGWSKSKIRAIWKHDLFDQ